MTNLEFSNQFDVLYNNITSNQAPGLDEYEKSVFLTKAQDEIIKNYFLKQSNPKQAGFDDNQKRQADFSNIMKTAHAGGSNATLTLNDKGKYVFQPKAKNVSLKDKGVFLIVNERLKVTRGDEQDSPEIQLVVKPISYDEYDRLMQKPYKYPTHYQAWRLMVDDNKTIDLVPGPNDTITEYYIRYIKRPNPIILENLTNGLSINAISTVSECELDPILHEEILQRAVELAKIAWTANGQDNAQVVIQTGTRSE